MNCNKCGAENPSFFTLKSRLWWEVVYEGDIQDLKQILCIDCVQERLGRKLTYSDFKDAAGLTRELLLGVMIYWQSPSWERERMDEAIHKGHYNAKPKEQK